MTYAVRSFVLAAACAVAGAAYAQDSRDTTRLRPVVVTATRTPMDQANVPASVTVISGDELRSRGVLLVADALLDVPGATLVRSGSFGATTSLFMRGGNSNYVKVLVDGVAVNDPGGAMDLAHLTTDNVDRIEIVRGPTSVVYGSDAVAGVVQIFTRDGTPGWHGSASMRGGTFGAREGRAEVAGGTSSVRYSLGGGSTTTDGILAFNNSYRNTHASAAVRLGSDATGDARLTARYVDATYHFPTDGSGRVVDHNAVHSEQRVILGVDAGRRFSDRFEGRVVAGSSRLLGSNSNLPDGPADTSGFYSTDQGRTDRRSGDARLNARIAGGQLVTLGGEYVREEVARNGSSQFASFAPSTSSFSEHRINTAYYSQWVGEAIHRLTFSVSGRVDDNAKFGTFTTGRAAAAVRIARGTRLRAAAGNAFKEPAFEETFSSAFTIGNPLLRPERTRGWEAGVEQTVAEGRLTFGATWFDQRFRDLIQYVSGDSTTGFRGTNDNIAAATSRGLEVEAHVAPLGGWSIGGSFTALRTRVTDAGTGAFGTFVDGATLLRRPSNTTNVDLAYAWHDRARFTAAAHFVGERDDRDFTANARVVLPGYTRVDASAEIGVLRSRSGAPSIDLTLRAENLFDRDYAPVLNFPAPGRTILVGARVGGGK